jgi:hypothetical protein
MLGFPALKCTDTVHGKRPYAAKRFMASLARRQFLRNHFRLCSVLWIVAFVPAVAHGVELKKKTIDAFDTYTRLTEERIDKEKDGPVFLYIDQLPEGQRKALQQRMAAGEVIINRMKTLEQGKEIEVPDGLIHHWRAIVFVPGANLAKTVALVQDYNNHERVYTPDVVRSKLLSRDGNDFHIFYRLRRKKVITVVMDTEYDVHYEPLGTKRMVSRSISSSIREIENPGQTNERAKPVGQDNGFMWRLNTYWHMEEKNGGVYIQCEAVSLSRDIPTGLGWMIAPFVESVPKESLVFTLGRTREALLQEK